MLTAAGISRVASGDPNRVTPVALARGRGLGAGVAWVGGRPGHRLGSAWLRRGALCQGHRLSTAWMGGGRTLSLRTGVGVSSQCSRHGFAAGWGGWGVVSVRAWAPSRNGEGWGWGRFPPPAAWHRVRVPSHPSRRKGRALRNTCHGELPWAREAMEKYGFFTKKGRERERPAAYHAPRHHLAAPARPPSFQPEPSRSPKWDRSGPWRPCARGCPVLRQYPPTGNPGESVLRAGMVWLV